MGVIHEKACKYWGVMPNEFSLWYDDEGGITKVEADELNYKVQMIMDRYSNSTGDANVEV